MKALGITPILNVSNMFESFDWFEKLGWEKVGIGVTRRIVASSVRVIFRHFFAKTAWEDAEKAIWR
jgi:hypothetical protein